MRIALLDLPSETRAHLFFPLGLMYVQAFLKQNGYPQTVLRRLKRIDQRSVAALIAELKPDVVGIPCLSGSRFAALALAKAIKKNSPAIKIVFGGQHASYLRAQVLREYPFVDYVVRGEGEVSFKQLADHLAAGKQKVMLPGVSGRDRHHRFLDGPQRECVDDLDTLPFPCYDDLQEAARSAGIFNIITSRGCPCSCAFCSEPRFYSRPWRRRSAKNIVAELRYLKTSFNPRWVIFNDTFLTADVKQSYELFEAIAREGFGFQLDVETRLDSIDAGLLEYMKKAGVAHVIFGLESGSEQILSAAGRRFSFEKAKEVIRMFEQAGIVSRGNIILGWPQDRWSSVLKTAQVLAELNPTYYKSTRMTLLPGSPLYDQMKANGVISDRFWLGKTLYPCYMILTRGWKGRAFVYCESVFLFVFFFWKTRSFRRLFRAVARKSVQLWDYLQQSYYNLKFYRRS